MAGSIPAFLGGSTPAVSAKRAKHEIQDVRKECRAALKAAGAGPAAAPAPAPAPAMAVQTIGAYTTAYTMSSALQDVLSRLSSFFSHLFAAPAPTAPAKPPKPPKQPPTTPGAKGDTDFVISSFNVLSTTAGMGKGYANYKQRMAWTVQTLNQRNVSVVGFQEMKHDQLLEFKRLAGDKYATFAGESGKKGYHDTTLAWRKDQWDLVKADTITVPSYAGIASKVPYVRLKNKQTGQEAYFVDVHNPANTKNYHHQEKYRDKAAQMETALVKQLSQSGLPVFMVGDFNSVTEARDIVTKGAPVVAASAQTGNRNGIDWIFGTKGVKFSKFSRTRAGMIAKATDHPAVFTQAHING